MTLDFNLLIERLLAVKSYPQIVGIFLKVQLVILG